MKTNLIAFLAAAVLSVAAYGGETVKMQGNTWYMLYGNFLRPTCPDSTVRLATSTDGVGWKSVNRDLFEGQDGEIIKVGGDIYLIYYGPRNYFDAANCDIRVAIYKGNLAGLAGDNRRYRDERDHF